MGTSAILNTFRAHIASVRRVSTANDAALDNGSEHDQAYVISTSQRRSGERIPHRDQRSDNRYNSTSPDATNLTLSSATNNSNYCTSPGGDAGEAIRRKDDGCIGNGANRRQPMHFYSMNSGGAASPSYHGNSHNGITSNFNHSGLFPEHASNYNYNNITHNYNPFNRPTQSMSWSEKLFFSQDDEDVSVTEDDDDDSYVNEADGESTTDTGKAFDQINANLNHNYNHDEDASTLSAFTITKSDSDGDGVTGIGNALPTTTTATSPTITSPPIPSKPPPPLHPPTDDETITNTVAEKSRQRTRKATRASNVGAFVTFLKALFGIGMLSNPAVLGEVGLVLGTFCHLFIVVGCAFACYLLLTARQLAKEEVGKKQRKMGEKESLGGLGWRERSVLKFSRERREERMRYERDRQEQQQYEQRHWQQRQSRQRDWEQQQYHYPYREDGTAHRQPTFSQQPQNSLDQLSVPQQYAIPPVQTFPSEEFQINHSERGWERCQASFHHAVESSTPNSPCDDGTVSAGPPVINADVNFSGNINFAAAATSSHNHAGISSPRLSILPEIISKGSTTSLLSLKHQDSGRSSEKEKQTIKPAVVSDAYHRIIDDPENPQPQLSHSREDSNTTASKKIPPVRLLTYGDVAKYLAGPVLSSFVIFTIVTVHLMFASGMVHLAVENLCYVVGWDHLGSSSYEEVYVAQGDSENDGDTDSAQNMDDNRGGGPERYLEVEEPYSQWEGPDFLGRLAMASLLFPIIQGLLQIPSLRELTTISSMGLLTYVIGCIGSMLYTAIVMTDGHPFLDKPEDMWQTKWSGIPTYVATTIYAIEGINLALPTVSSLEGNDRIRWGGGFMRRNNPIVGGVAGGEGDKQNHSKKSVFIVVGAVFLYGLVTLVVSWVGLAGGLGGGIGTMHGEDGCRDVTYCFDSSAVRFVYMLSLGVALILTLPVILFPSTQMLEIWLDEREDERRRKMLASMQQADKMPKQQLRSIRKTIRERSIIEDDETLYTVPHNSNPGQKNNERRNLRRFCTMMEMQSLKPWKPDGGSNGHYQPPIRDNSNDTIHDSTPVKSNTNANPDTRMRTNTTANSTAKDPNKNDDSAATFGREPLTIENDSNYPLKPRRKLKYWKLRMFLAFLICLIGTLEGSFPVVLTAAEVIRGVGLSIAGLIFPPLLYMSAVGGRFSGAMAAAMALLIGLGLFNIVLVLMSAFGGKDFIVEEGPGHSFYANDLHAD